MLRFQSFLSGSSGNSTFITDGSAKVLVDCGANGKYITECLNRLDVNPGEIDAILVTHAHRDHICGVGVMSRKYDIPIMASEGTWEEIGDSIGSIATRNTLLIKESEKISLGEMEVTPFSIPHDAKDSMAFRLETQEMKMAIATDIGYISDELLKNLSGCDCVIIEANHDIEMLRNGRYPYYLKRRILSRTGHLSNGDSAKLCTMLAKDGTKSFWLGHLSNENNTPDLAYNTVKNAFLEEGIDVGGEVGLNVLPRFWLEG